MTQRRASTSNPRSPAPRAAVELSPTVARLAACGQRRRFRKGTLLIHEGDFGDTLFVLLAGRVRVFASDHRQREITFGIYGPGEYFGEMALDGGPRSASVVTLETCECALVTRVALRAQIASHPDLAFELLTRVIRRARLATQTARGLALVDVYGRLTQWLEQAAGSGEGPRTISGFASYRELASLMGCSREMVGRILHDLQHGGYLQLGRRSITLLQRLPERW